MRGRSVQHVQVDGPGNRTEGATGRAAALRYIVRAALADELVGVPVRAVVAGRVAVAQPQHRPSEPGWATGREGGAAGRQLGLAVPAGIKEVREKAGFNWARLVPDRTGAQEADNKG